MSEARRVGTSSSSASGPTAARVRVYTTTYCGYCRAAKRLLDRHGIAFEEVDVTDDEERRAWLVATTGRRTVPQIVVGEDPVGGYEALCALERRGELVARLTGHHRARLGGP